MMYGRTPLHWTAIKSTAANITALLRRGAKVNVRNLDGETPLTFAANKDTAIVITLLDAGADVNAKNRTGTTSLHRAASSGSSANVIALLDAGADAKAKDKYGFTPFFWAEELKRREEFVGTEGYWALRDAQYD